MIFCPRRWWGGPLDVERLAWESVSAARDAAQTLSDARGQDSAMSTTPALVAASFGAIEHLLIDGRRAESLSSWSGFFAVSDGWVRLHGNYPHHRAAISRVTGATSSTELGPVLAERTAAEVEDAITAERGVAVAVRTPADWAAHAQCRETADTPWCTAFLMGERARLSGDDLPLSGVHILDLTRVIAGPTCSQLLACLGADVLRIDPPAMPELLDQYLSNGMGKSSAAVDLSNHLSALEMALQNTDVVLLGYRPGSLDRFGLNPMDLIGNHPNLIVASLSAWGDHGPWAQRQGFDSIVQAACGIATLYGTAERPGALPVQALDHATGYLMAAEIMQLLGEARSGIIQLNLLGAARTLLSLEPAPDTARRHPGIGRVRLNSPHGRLSAVPPPLLVNGRTIERPPGAYGRSQLSWKGSS